MRSRRLTAALVAAALAAVGPAAVGAPGGAVVAPSSELLAEATAEPTNVALLAEPAASYTPEWNNVGAVNDGEGVHTGGSHGAVWATWSGDRPATQWLEYAWSTPVEVNRSVMMFWTDGADANGDNIRVPQAWTIQYWDAATEQFLDLPDASGYGTERLALNETTFTPVTTTRLRATFEALPNPEGTSYSGVGVAEWEVWGTGGSDEPPPVDESDPIDVRPVHIPTPVGVVPELPTVVDGVFADGVVRPMDVTWETVTADQVAVAGSFDVAGTSPSSSLPLVATVHVRDGEPGPAVVVDYVSVVTLAGTAPVLPPTVTVEYEDGSLDSRIPVVWDDVDPAAYAEADAMFFVAGDVDGTELAAEAVVFVMAADDGTDTAAPTITATLAPQAQPSGWHTETTTLTVTVRDNRDAAPVLELRTGEGAWAPYAGPVELTDGEHAVGLRATDAAGNVREQTVTVRVDATAPVTVATVERVGDSVEVTLEATDAGSGVDRIQWEGPGTFWGTYTEPFTRALADEPQVLEFAATDAAGNAEERQQLTLPALEPGSDDSTAPVVSGSFDAAARTVTVVATDDVGVVSVEYRLGASGEWAAYTGPVAVGDAAVTVFFRASDAAGNVSVVGSVDVPAAEEPWTPPVFADVSEGHPFYADIRWLADTGLSEGTEVGDETFFYPTSPMSRQAMAAFLYRYAGDGWTPEAGTQSFTDVAPGHPFHVAVEWMAEVGLAEGYADGSFGATRPVSRQATAAFLHRLAGEPVPTEDADFTDVHAGHLFEVAIAWLQEAGVTTGYADGSFGTTKPVTRQAMAAFLHRFDAAQD